MATKLFLEKAYLAYFGRPVDPTGLVAFANSTEAEVAAAFSASPESQALFGPTFGAAQINLIYLTLFGRPAEAAGVAYWLNEVARGALTTTGAAMGILKGAQNEDITSAANKLAASTAFTTSLDTAAEIQGYAGNDAAAVARSFLKGITSTPASEAQVTAAAANSTGIFGITAAADIVQEGGDVVFKLTLGSIPAKALTFNYNTGTGTASSADFVSVAGQVTFAVGQTVAFVTIKTIDDAVVESAESFTLTVSGANLSSAVTASATIIDQADIDAAAAALAAKTFTLTTGVDSVVGTAGNDTIVAVLNTNVVETVTYSPGYGFGFGYSVSSTTDHAGTTLNVGDTINGGNGIDTLSVFAATTGNGFRNGSNVDLRGVTISGVEKLVINDVNNRVSNDSNLGSNDFTSVTLQNFDGASVYGIKEGTAIIAQAAAGTDYNSVHTHSDATTAASVAINDTFQGNASATDGYAEFDHGYEGTGLSKATTINATLNLLNANSANGNSDRAEQYINATNAETVSTAITANINVADATSDGSNNSGAYTYIERNADSTVTANINVSNSADVDVAVYANDNGSASSAKVDVANVTLNNVTNADYSAVTGRDFEQVNITVNGASSLDNLEFWQRNDTPTSQTVTIVANANLTVGYTDFNDEGSVAVVVSGAGNVGLGNYDGTYSTLSSTVTSTIDASALTGKLTINVRDASTSITSGSGDDSITLSSAAFGKVVTGAGDDKVTLGSGAAAGTSIDAGAGTDTLSGNASVLAALDNTATDSAKFANFELLEVTGNLDRALDTTKIQAGLNVVTLNAASTTGAAVTFGTGASTLNLKAAAVDAFAVASAGLGIADSVTVTNMAAAVDVFNGKAINATGVETLILNGSGNGAATKQTVGAITLTGTDLDGAGAKTVLASTSVKFVGTNSFSVTSIAADSVDASGLTGTAGLKASTSALQVTGSAAADDLTVTAVTAAAIADLPATTANEAVAAVNATVSTGAGNDTIVISTSGTGLTTVNAGAGNDTIVVSTSGTGATIINAGDGNDAVYVEQRGTGVLTVNLGAGNDSFSVNTTGCGPVVINGTDVIDGGAGTDTLLLSLIGSANVGAFKNFEVMDAVGLDHALDAELLNATNTVTEFIASGSVNSGASLINVGAGVGVRVTGSMNDTSLSIAQKTAGALTVTLDTDRTLATESNSADLFVHATNATSLKAVFAADSAFVQTSAVKNFETINLMGDEATSLEVVSGGTNATNVLNYTAGNGVLTSVTITGAQHLDISGLSTAGASQLATIDASAFTGGLTVDLGDLKDGGTIKLGSGVDLITVSTVGVTESISGFEKAIATAFGTTALPASVADSDTLVFTGANVADAGSFSGGVIAKGVLTFTGAGPSTFADATAIANLAAETAGEALVFNYLADSYLFVQGGNSADTMVQLVGITGVSQFAETSTTDHFILG